MKILPILFAIILLIIFIFSASNTYKSYSSINKVVNVSAETAAFDPSFSKIAGFEEAENRMSQMISTFQKDERSLKIWGVILNLLVTIATGLTALVTSISTARNNAVSKTASVTIAVITFVAFIVSFSQGQINTEKENATKKIEAVKKIRDEMEALKGDEVPGQLPQINRSLDEI